MRILHPTLESKLYSTKNNKRKYQTFYRWVEEVVSPNLPVENFKINRFYKKFEDEKSR